MPTTKVKLKIDELYKKIDNIVRHVAKEVQNDLADNKSKTVEWCRKEFPKETYRNISLDPFRSFCADKFCEFEDCFLSFSDDYGTEGEINTRINENKNEINAKIKKALDLIRTRICIQTGKDLQNIKDLENAAFKKIREEISKHTLNISTQDIINSLLPTYDWSEEDWISGNKNLERLLFIRVAKAFAETLHREEPMLSVIKTVGTLCANAINFVIPALAVSLLPEKIRGTTKDLFVTTFLTIMADGLTGKTVNSLIKPAGLLGLVSFAAGWNTKTIYGLLKNELISK